MNNKKRKKAYKILLKTFIIRSLKTIKSIIYNIGIAQTKIKPLMIKVNVSPTPSLQFPT